MFAAAGASHQSGLSKPAMIVSVTTRLTEPLPTALWTSASTAGSLWSFGGPTIVVDYTTDQKKLLATVGNPSAA